MKQKVLSRLLSGVMALSMVAAMGVTAFASGNVKYDAGDEHPHTVRWAEGIAEPELPHGDRKGNFQLETVTVLNENFSVMAVPYRGAQGWYDLTTMAFPDPEDPEKEILNSGYAAAAANVTYWWLEQNQENLQRYLDSDPKTTEDLADPRLLRELLIAPASQEGTESPIYNLYLKAFPQETQPDQLLDFFLNGYASSGKEANREDQYQPNQLGGFFYPVFHKTLLTSRKEVNLETLRKAIALNNGAILRLEKGEDIRYMNLWGVETQETGELCALYVTDSLDDLGMVRYETKEEGALKIAGMEITDLYTVELGEVLFSEFPFKDPKPVTPAEKPSDPPEKPEQKPQEKPEEKPEILWQKPTYTWSEDNRICTAQRKAENDSGKKETESAVASVEKKDSVSVYTAQFSADWAETQVKTQEHENVVWNPTTYRWDESMRICYAERTVQGQPSIRETAEAGVTAKETKAPTCTKKGETTFTAVFEEPWAATQQKTMNNIPTLTPNWDTTEYKWSQWYDSCTATRVCKNEADGSHVEKVMGTVTQEQTRKPTSSKKGETTYKASFPVDWADQQILAVENIPALGEKWGQPTYTWSEDHQICTAQRADQNDPGRVEKLEGKVTAEKTKDPTCQGKGETTYTAVFSADWAVKQVKTVADIPALTPEWGEVQYQWTNHHRNCTAVRVCKNEKNHVESAEATVSYERTQKPTLTEMGETTYTAVFDEDWAQRQVLAVWDVPVIADLWFEPRYEWNKDLTQCIAKRTNQKDQDIFQTAAGTITSKKTKLPTHDMMGETTYTAVFDEPWARTQKKVLANIPNIPGNPHGKPEPPKPVEWKTATYEWSDDFSRCTARRVRKDDPSHVDLSWAEVTRKELEAPTCAKPGKAVYTARFSEKWAEKQTIEGKIPPLPHELQKVDEVAATAGKEGLQTHYECKVCHKLFSDPDGLQEVTRDQLKLEKPSVSAGYAILNGVPEKDNQVAIDLRKFRKTLEQNPGALGVSIAVGNATVTYDQKDIEAIEKAAGKHEKIQLQLYATDLENGALTPEQIRSAERNPQGSLYYLELSYVKNGKSIPVQNLEGSSVTVPYAGTDAVRSYCLQEDGSFREVESTAQDAFVRFRGGNGVYMLSESRPSAEAPRKSGGKISMIIWTVVLILSVVLLGGFAGFYFYQKKLDKQETRNPHRFSAAGSHDTDPEPSPQWDDTAEGENQEFDSDFLKELGLDEDFTPAAGSADHLAEPKAAGEKKSPAAPKAPMEPKPSIAEKTAEAAAHKHSKV